MVIIATRKNEQETYDLRQKSNLGLANPTQNKL